MYVALSHLPPPSLFTLQERFPYPKLLECDQGDSQSRFLNSVVNPSITHSTASTGRAADGHEIVSDDVSLQVFMESLKKLGCQS